MARGIAGLNVLIMSHDSRKYKKRYQAKVKYGRKDHVACRRGCGASIGGSRKVVDGVDGVQ